MPYKPSDAKRFDKDANTPRKKRQWKHVYDSMRQRGFSEARSIRAASSAVGHGKR